jgi:hypothetical protein
MIRHERTGTLLKREIFIIIGKKQTNKNEDRNIKEKFITDE